MKSLLTVTSVLFCLIFLSCCTPRIIGYDHTKKHGDKDKDDDNDIVKRGQAIIDASQIYNPKAMVTYYRKADKVIIDDPAKSQIVINNAKLDILLGYSSILGCTTELFYAAFDSASAEVYAKKYNASIIDPTTTKPITYLDIWKRQTYVLQICCDGNVQYAYIAKLCPPPPNCDFTKVTSD